MGHLSVGSARRVCVSDTSEEEEDERVKCVQVVPHVALLDQLLPVYCCTEVLSHEDNKALTFDSGRTGAHPATDAILFGASSRLVT